ncbi:unnamed protein product [Diamesa serratosioi]
MVMNRGLLVSLLFGAITCYLILSYWISHRHISNMKSVINTVIDKSKKQNVINTNEETVDKNEVLLINETRHNQATILIRSFHSLREIIKCKNREFIATKELNGQFYVLKNYIKADHGDIQCFETITISTFGDYTFLDNLVPLIERWIAPVSLALNAPGSDFDKTLLAIMYLRKCNGRSSKLIRKYVTFHLVFDYNHLPRNVPKDFQSLEKNFVCDREAFIQSDKIAAYKKENNLTFPINVLRNIARRASLTHFVFASDIELYPSVGLIDAFFDMIMKNTLLIENGENNVFFLPVFEIHKNATIPNTKKELQKLFKENKAQYFHKIVCSMCHRVPKDKEWIEAAEGTEMTIYASTKRQFLFRHWEPFFIGTNKDPGYDERLTWEGKFNKMTQAYTMCLQNYNFLGLSNAFMIHKPGFKTMIEAIKNRNQNETLTLVKNDILPQIDLLYGKRKNCHMFI